MELSYTSTGSSATGSGRGLYFSSPITNATAGIFNVAAGSNLLWYQNEILRQYVKVTSNTHSLDTAKGYILRTPTSQVFNFTGTPNTDPSYTISNIPRAVDGQFYLVGNPYPTVIDWQTIFPTAINLTNTIWYNTSTTDGTMVVDTWNKENGGVGTDLNGTATVDGKIAPMQSFWVQCTAVGLSGTLTIANTDRTNNWGSSQFIKSPAQFSSTRSIIRMYLYTKDKVDETILLQSESAQDELDKGDSKKMFLNNPYRAEIFTLSPEKETLAIQSIKPVSTSKDIQLGLSVGALGEYRFVANLSEFTSYQNVILEDKLLNITQDLSINPEYIFKSEAVETSSRFVIHLLSTPTIIVNSLISVCSSEAADITSQGIQKGTDPDLTLTYWTDAKASIPYGTPKQAEVGTYYIKGTSKYGAYKISDPITVVINPTPKIVVSSLIESNSPVDLTSPTILLGSTPDLLYSYWLDSDCSLPNVTPQLSDSGNYFIKGTIESTGCYSVAGPIKVINPTSNNSENFLEETTSIYSSNNTIHIVNFELNSTISVFDILGNQQLCKVSKSNHESITSILKPGVYVVRVKDSKGFSSKKIIIQ